MHQKFAQKAISYPSALTENKIRPHYKIRLLREIICFDFESRTKLKTAVRG